MSNNPLSNMSYTNKDFNAIYKELLDLVKTLTYKWDPSISNESDPGNILLKLDAIIGDKNNYNIDKNILENFPETLTQDISARSLYKQLAYRMPWYQAATTKVNFKWIGKDNNELTNDSRVKIDKFQLITDVNNEFVYTTLNDAIFTRTNKSQTVDAIEGIITTLTLNGQSYIELNNLDQYNRVYFNETTVAENGIFIYNLNGASDDYWTMVDNLQIEPLGKKNFEFGIDSRRNLCYVEFPSDINTLIGNGLVIKYIITNGSQGNIISKTLDRFYQDVSVNVNGQDVVLDRSTLYITNESGTSNGADPEDLRTAYNNYRKTAGTFHTLVTLRDYMNAIYNSGLVSNVKVCDRLNDVQSTYEIVPDSSYSGGIITQEANSGSNGYIGYCKTTALYDAEPAFVANKFFTFNSTTKTMTAVLSSDFSTQWRNTYTLVDEDMDDMEAFDLKLYMLHSPGQVENYEQYESTFDMEAYNNDKYNLVLAYIKDEKCVQHNFSPLLPNIPCLFKNSFPLNMKVIPHYKLMQEQINELKININKTLFKNLNAYYAEFGEEPSYDKIYDMIFNSDDRIKALVLDEFDYTTYATYWTGNEFKDIPISEFKSDRIKIFKNLTELKNSVDTLRSNLGDTLFKKLYLFDSSTKTLYKVDDNGNLPSKNNDLIPYSSLLQDIRTNIIAKSILAGRTPFASVDNLFQYCVDQQKIELIDTDKISTYLEVYPHGSSAILGTSTNYYRPITINKSNLTEFKKVSYKVGPNENLRFLAPSFTTAKTYGNYVKYECILNTENADICYERNMPLSFEDDLNNSSYRDKPIIFCKNENDGDTSETSTFDIKCPDNLKEPKDFSAIIIDGQDGFVDYLQREVIVRESGVIKHKGKLGSILLDDKILTSDFITKWKNGTISIQSDLFIEDLSTVQVLEWQLGTSAVTYKKLICNISADTDYELGEGESITFFYKTEDSDNAPYVFERYGKGEILNANFPIYAVSQSNAIIGDLQESSGEIRYDSLKDSKYQKISAMYDYNDLSGTKSIAMRKLNQVELKYNERRSYYFITNNTDDHNNYILQPDSKGYYTLNNDEYFIHLNEDKTMFEMLGAGTLLKFTTTNNGKEAAYNAKLTVKKVDYVDIMNKGLSTFADKCVLLSSKNLNIVITEQQLYNFSKDDVVTFTLTNEKCDKINKGETLPAPVLKTGSQTSMKDFEISYVSANVRSTLPKIALNSAKSDYSWQASAILNLYCSHDEPQIIGVNKANMKDDNSQNRGSVYRAIKINGTTHTSKEHKNPIDTDLYLLSNVPINKVGGTNIDITYFDSFGNRTKPFLFLYRLDSSYIQGYNNTSLTKLVDGSIVVKAKALKKGELPLNIQSYKGHHILLKIKNKSAATFTLQMGQSESKEYRPINFDISKSNGKYDYAAYTYGYGIYYIELPSTSNEQQYSLILKVNDYQNLANEDTLIIDTLYKFEYNKIFEDKYGITQDSINERILAYDINNVFDYANKVSEDKFIQDPLDSKSFFNKAHIFNSFTIPMADLYMSDKSESNITLINNR